MSQNIYSYTSGQRGGSPVINGAPANGASTLVTNGWTASAANRVKAGDVFTIAGVFSVNPLTKVSTGVLQQFVVTADTSSDGSGNASIPVAPAMYFSGSLQNISIQPPNSTALTFLPALSTVSANNLVYHKNAFILATADLDLPGGVDMAARASDPDAGVSLRIVRAYDINNDLFPCRLDILYGWLAARPQFACKILG